MFASGQTSNVKWSKCNADQWQVELLVEIMQGLPVKSKIVALFSDADEAVFGVLTSVRESFLIGEKESVLSEFCYEDFPTTGTFLEVHTEGNLL